nr:MAK10-like protein [Tanacetum cinerariifolium]
MGDKYHIRTLGDYSKPSHKGYRITTELPEGNNVIPLQSKTIRLVQNRCLIHGLRSEYPNQHLKDFLKLVDSLDLNSDNRERTEFAIPVKVIYLPQDVTSTFDRCLIKPKNKVKLLMEAHLTPKQPVQVNKISSSCKICSCPHDTQYCVENPEQAFVDYASSCTDEAREPKQTLKDEFKDFHLNLQVIEALTRALMYNAILDKYVESLELGKNGFAFIQGKIPKRVEDPGLFTLPCRLGDSKSFDTLADLGSCANIIPLYLFKKLKIRLLEETDHVFGLADGTKSYPVEIVRDVEVHIRRLKLLDDFYVNNMKKDPETPLLVERGLLATANAVIIVEKPK